jgi:hypothetical protein
MQYWATEAKEKPRRFFKNGGAFLFLFHTQIKLLKLNKVRGASSACDQAVQIVLRGSKRAKQQRNLSILEV